MSAGSNWRTIKALISRAGNEIIRVPGAAIPGVLAPTIFFLGLNSAFGHLTDLRGFNTTSYMSFIIPVSLLQGAGFTGAATGVNLARDIEQGWFDRLIVSPAPRWVLLAGMVLSASVRALIPAGVVFSVGMIFGVHWPGLVGLAITIFVVMAMASMAGFWGVMLALRYKSQSAAPLMQSGMFVFILFSTAYAPLALLQGWLHRIATINPATHVLEAVRQGFIGSVTWGDTWPGMLALAGMMALLGTLALRGMNRAAV